MYRVLLVHVWEVASSDGFKEEDVHAVVGGN